VLRFQGKDLILARKLASFVEVYRRRVPVAEIPRATVTFGQVTVNGMSVELVSPEAIYPKGVPDYADATARDGQVVIAVGKPVEGLAPLAYTQEAPVPTQSLARRNPWLAMALVIAAAAASYLAHVSTLGPPSALAVAGGVLVAAVAAGGRIRVGGRSVSPSSTLRALDAPADDRTPEERLGRGHGLDHAQEHDLVGFDPDAALFDAEPASAVRVAPRAAPPVVIVIDPAHGGTDTGATNGAVNEKDVTLNIATLLKTSLDALAMPATTVTLTRFTDVAMTNDERVKAIRAAGATMLVSLHANLEGGLDPTGAGMMLAYTPKGLTNAQKAYVRGFRVAWKAEVGNEPLKDRVTAKVPLEQASLKIPAVVVRMGDLNDAGDFGRLQTDPSHVVAALSLALQAAVGWVVLPGDHAPANQTEPAVAGPAVGRILADTKAKTVLLVQYTATGVSFPTVGTTTPSDFMAPELVAPLTALATAAAHEWTSVTLAVVAGWIDSGSGAHDDSGGRSVHYEGRALDLRTEPEDRDKLPRLAMLAMQSGFGYADVCPSGQPYLHVSLAKRLVVPLALSTNLPPGDEGSAIGAIKDDQLDRKTVEKKKSYRRYSLRTTDPTRPPVVFDDDDAERCIDALFYKIYELAFLARAYWTTRVDEEKLDHSIAKLNVTDGWNDVDVSDPGTYNHDGRRSAHYEARAIDAKALRMTVVSGKLTPVPSPEWHTTLAGLAVRGGLGYVSLNPDGANDSFVHASTPRTVPGPSDEGTMWQRPLIEPSSAGSTPAEIALAALTFWCKWLGLESDSGPITTSTSDPLFSRLYAQVRAVSWQEGAHGTIVPGREFNHPSRDPMQTGHPKDTWWAGDLDPNSAKSTAISRSDNTNPKAKTIPPMMELAQSQTDGFAPEALFVCLRRRSRGHNDIGFTATMSYFWGVLALIHKTNAGNNVAAGKDFDTGDVSWARLFGGAFWYNANFKTDYRNHIVEALSLQQIDGWTGTIPGAHPTLFVPPPPDPTLGKKKKVVPAVMYYGARNVPLKDNTSPFWAPFGMRRRGVTGEEMPRTWAQLACTPGEKVVAVVPGAVAQETMASGAVEITLTFTWGAGTWVYRYKNLDSVLATGNVKAGDVVALTVKTGAGAGMVGLELTPDGEDSDASVDSIRPLGWHVK
jgi:N-acetylmuramoyl-L-alanine amidase